MHIHHHPSNDTLLAYAAGIPTEAMSLVIATHLEGCERCRECVRQAGGVAGATCAAIESPAMRDGAQGPIHEDTAADPPRPPPQREPSGGNLRPKGALAAYLTDDLDALPWRASMRGVRYHRLPIADTGHGTIRLFKIALGTKIPHHGHRGTRVYLSFSKVRRHGFKPEARSEKTAAPMKRAAS